MTTAKPRTAIPMSLSVVGLALCLCLPVAMAGFVGEDLPESFSMCEELGGSGQAPRPECEGSDVRFRSTGAGDSQFGFSLASGNLNGDAFEDLVVGDPQNNRVYVFFGRKSLVAGYELDPLTEDRTVVAEDRADLILEPPGSVAIGSLGFSIAVGEEQDATGCGDDELAAPLLIGAPGTPGVEPGLRGAALYLAAGTLCFAVENPATPETLDPVALGQGLRSTFVDAQDEFGYSVAFGRLLEDGGDNQDVVVGARGAMGGAGRVTVFPVNGGVVDEAFDKLVEIAGREGDGLGEVLASGNLDDDFDEEEEPQGDEDDLAVGAVGTEAGTVYVVQGPLSATGGGSGDGVYGVDDDAVRTIDGEQPGDFFGFSVALSVDGRFAVGAVFADNDPPGENGGDPATNVGTIGRTHCGKVYVWGPGVFNGPEGDLGAASAALTVVGRRSGDHLGFGVAFDELNANQNDLDLEEILFSALREDGTGLSVDEIDQGTVYVAVDNTFLSSPVDLGACSAASDCTGVANINVMLFGGDRTDDVASEIGFAVDAGDFNGDGSAELYASSIVRRQVYAVSLLDSDDDRETVGRNLRDDDDDGDDDPDSTDCAPLDPDISGSADEVFCNEIDENCNGDEDDAPDDDGDGFDLCGDEETQEDCDDNDPDSFPGADELCDGNDNACGELIPPNERDVDGDGYVECEDWADTQEDNENVLGGGDCDDLESNAFPGVAELEENPEECRRDTDGDGYGEMNPPEGIEGGTDCDDISLGASFTFPGAASAEASPDECRKDEDGDGYGDDDPLEGVDPGSDCDDADAISFPGAAEICDGNDNACTGDLPDDELDLDDDQYLACTAFDDVQGDDPDILGGDDCAAEDEFTHPSAGSNEVNPDACRRDIDGDGWGDVVAPEDGVAGTDCDDLSEVTFPGAAEVEAPQNCMKDADDDGFGDTDVLLPVVAGNDCDDDDASSFLDAEEVVDDGIDQDCNGFDSVTCFEDLDRDGFGSLETLISDDGDCDDPGESTLDTDCNDGDDEIYPDAEEIVDDGIDQDCNEFDTITCIVDADGDGFGAESGETVLADDESCDAEQNEATTADDCDDADATTYPDAKQLCDGNDNTCADSLPADETDGDGDGWVVCSGWDDVQGDDPDVLGGDDCEDTADDIFPGAAVNEAAADACMRDRDRDGFGDPDPPEGIVAGTDCDDLSPDTFPGAAAIDGPFNCMRDADDDDYGDSSATLPVVAGTDCADADPASFPGAPELCDGNDNACSGEVPPEEIDDDGDLYVECNGWADPQGDQPEIVDGGDCAEGDSATFPGAAPNENFANACMTDSDGDDYGNVVTGAGVTPGTDCDDASDVTFPGAAEVEAPLNCMRDADDDGYGDAAAALPVVPGQDCADDEPSANPGQIEGPIGDATCGDGLDNDCDANLDGDDPGCQDTGACPDVDDDGFADCTTEPTCDDTGLTCGDCDDLDPDINPGAAEVCDNVDNNCDGTVDEGFDQDDDGFTTCDLPEPDCDDGDADVNPLELEACADGIDNDCDAGTPDVFDMDGDGADCQADCDDNDAQLNLDDLDKDTFDTCDGDCDDGDGDVNPGTPEVCGDATDNDCNSLTPDVFDADEDGADCLADCDDGDPLLNQLDEDMDTFSTCDGDCDDEDGAVNPDATEVCDSVDNDCDGVVDGEFDGDGDGFTTCSGPFDCDDGDPLTNPGAPEICGDDKDNDCNDVTPDLFDIDGDGAACDVDCDDQDVNSFPGADELCDGNDNNCDLLLPTAETDPDADGYAGCPDWDDTQGDNPGITGGGDCDNGAADTFPGAAAAEPFAEACMKDTDLDGYGDLDPPAGVTSGTDCDDDSNTTFPGAAQIEAPLNCMRDDDDDGYGDADATLPVVPGGDCDDSEPLVSLGFDEGIEDSNCNDGLDNDCDGLTDAADPECLPPAPPRTDRKRPTRAIDPGRVRTVGPRGGRGARQSTQDSAESAPRQPVRLPVPGVPVFYLLPVMDDGVESLLDTNPPRIERPDRIPRGRLEDAGP
ncbi:MAG: hypothetical protein GY716_12115 [bacterium]|nr:hypothetical protein [bacterium]